MREPPTDADLNTISSRHFCAPGVPNALGSSCFGKETLALIAEVRRLRATVCLKPGVAQCAQLWEADHQRRHLEHLGLADEFNYGCDAIEHVATALLAAREEVRRLRAERHWIPLAERAPPDDCRVLVVGVSGTIHVGRRLYLTGEIRPWTIGGCRFPDSYFTHWMPLPKPPS